MKPISHSFTKIAAVVAFGLTTGAPGLAAPGDAFITSSGVSVSTPPVARMDCDALKSKLRQIDDTGYRGVQPSPPDPRDKPLFEYEHEVAHALYEKCPEQGMGALQSEEVFREGFRN